MLQVNIRDANFGCSTSGWNAPKYFNWCRDKQNGVCFFTDYCLGDVTTTQASKKIAWLLEPPTICPASYDYVQKNYNKFDYILTYDRSLIDGKKTLFYPFGGCWMPDAEDRRGRQSIIGVHNKKHLVSIIASDKTCTAGHQLRHTVIKNHPQIDAFGPQYRQLEYKEDALVDYMFSIVIENSILDDYFTEKLVDCFAVGTIPIYCGTRNIGNYFNMNGILTFSNDNELTNILNKLSAQSYYDRSPHIVDNYNKHFQYRVAENWIFEHYRHLFST